MYLALDFEPDVKDVRAQPLRLSNWVPDCLVLTSERQLLVEVKYECELVERWSELSARYSVLDQRCSERDFVFRIITDDSVYHSQVNRSRLLKAIRTNAVGRFYNTRIADVIQDCVSSKGEVTIRELAASVDQRKDSSLSVREVCKVLARGPRYLLQFPTPNLLDCIVMMPRDSENEPAGAISLEVLGERIRTHPLRFLSHQGATVVA